MKTDFQTEISKVTPEFSGISKSRPNTNFPNFLKKVLFIGFALFLVHQSHSLILHLEQGGYPSDPGTVLLQAFFINLFITGVFAFVGFAFPTYQLLPDEYYRIRHPVALRKLYHYLGIESFRWVLLMLFWRREVNRKKYFNGKVTGLPDFIIATKRSEFGHLGAFFALCVLAVHHAGRGQFRLALISSLINTAGNLYPLILQRYHRLRINQLSSVLQRRRVRGQGITNHWKSQEKPV